MPIHAAKSSHTEIGQSEARGTANFFPKQSAFALAVSALCLMGCVDPITATLTDSVMSNANAVDRMNCTQMKAHYNKINNPLALMNPTRMASAEKQLIRVRSRELGCPIG